jgi:hypothetical protein
VLLGARHVHPLARPQQAAPHHFTPHVAPVDRDDPQHDRAVGEVDVVAGSHPLCDLGHRGRDAFLVAFDLVAREHERLTGVELDLFTVDRTGPQFRARQVDQYADRA